MYNVYAEEEEDGESSAAAQQSLENFITMTKMKLLKAKMEDMNLNKKVGACPDHRATELQFYRVRVQMQPGHSINFRTIFKMQTHTLLHVIIMV